MMRTTASILAVATAATLAAGCRLPDITAQADSAPATLDGLTVAPEDTGVDYDRDRWPHWAYIGDGCDVRDQILQRDGDRVRVGEDCELSGTWYSTYDGITLTDPSDLDIDHVVPLGEAADSGVRGWTEADREQFANDPTNLIAVTASSNRAKGDQDPAEWLPQHGRCAYVEQWVQVKTTYRLTVDPAEAEAIATVDAGCKG